MSTRLYRTGSLRAAGYTYDELRRLLRDGSLATVRRGSYVAGHLPDDAHERHRLDVRAAAGDLSPGAVFSHVSAAVLHGLTTWRTSLARVHATRNRHSGGRVSHRVHIHVAALAPDDVTTVDGLPVTSLARTVADVARSVPFEQGVVVADAALASGLVTSADLAAAVDGLVGRRGAPRARFVIDFADDRAESVGESRSRVAIARADLPAPVPQWNVRDRFDRVIGRVDFGWPERGVAGEFDGAVRYGRLLRPGETAADAVFREKLREDALRETLRTVVRWTWSDLDNFAPVAARIRRALS